MLPNLSELPTPTFQPLHEDGNNADEHDAVATGRTLQKQLRRHGVAHGRAAGTKRKPETGFTNTTFWIVVGVLVAGGVALTLFLTLS